MLLRIYVITVCIKCFLLSKMGCVHMSEVCRHLQFLYANTKIWHTIAGIVTLAMGWTKKEKVSWLIASMIRGFCVLQNVWTGFGAHPNCWAVILWSMKLTLNLHLVPCLRMDVAVCPCPHISLWYFIV